MVQRRIENQQYRTIRQGTPPAWPDSPDVSNGRVGNHSHSGWSSPDGYRMGGFWGDFHECRFDRI